MAECLESFRFTNIIQKSFKKCYGNQLVKLENFISTAMETFKTDGIQLYLNTIAFGCAIAKGFDTDINMMCYYIVCTYGTIWTKQQTAIYKNAVECDKDSFKLCAPEEIEKFIGHSGFIGIGNMPPYLDEWLIEIEKEYRLAELYTGEKKITSNQDNLSDLHVPSTRNIHTLYKRKHNLK